MQWERARSSKSAQAGAPPRSTVRKRDSQAIEKAGVGEWGLSSRCSVSLSSNRWSWVGTSERKNDSGSTLPRSPASTALNDRTTSLPPDVNDRINCISPLTWCNGNTQNESTRSTAKYWQKPSTDAMSVSQVWTAKRILPDVPPVGIRIWGVGELGNGDVLNSQLPTPNSRLPTPDSQLPAFILTASPQTISGSTISNTCCHSAGAQSGLARKIWQWVAQAAMR